MPFFALVDGRVEECPTDPRRARVLAGRATSIRCFNTLGCGAAMSVVAGQRNAPHFRHLREDGTCRMDQLHRGEQHRVARNMIVHRQMQEDLAAWAHGQGLEARLEVVSTDRSCRTDLSLTLPERNLAIEVQRSPITAAALRERTRRYTRAFGQVVWLWDPGTCEATYLHEERGGTFLHRTIRVAQLTGTLDGVPSQTAVMGGVEVRTITLVGVIDENDQRREAPLLQCTWDEDSTFSHPLLTSPDPPQDEEPTPEAAPRSAEAEQAMLVARRVLAKRRAAKDEAALLASRAELMSEHREREERPVGPVPRRIEGWEIAPGSPPPHYDPALLVPVRYSYPGFPRVLGRADMDWARLVDRASLGVESTGAGWPMQEGHPLCPACGVRLDAAPAQVVHDAEPCPSWAREHGIDPDDPDQGRAAVARLVERVHSRARLSSPRASEVTA